MENRKFKRVNPKQEMIRHKIAFTIAMIALLVLIVLCFTACEKSAAPSNAPASSTQASSLKVKLEVWYELNDSIMFSPAHPCGDIVSGYVKQTLKWYECTSPKTGGLHYITIQQTGVDLILSDSMRLTIFIDGSKVQEVAGKKLLTASYIY